MFLTATAQAIQDNSTNISGMSDDLKGAIITAMVTGIISIIGFIVTNMSMRKSFKNELAMQRDSTALEKMASIPYEALNFYDIIMRLNQVNKEYEKHCVQNPTKAQLVEKKRIEKEKLEIENVFLDKMNYLYNTIYAYGSPTAIKIVSKMQSLNYILGETASEDEKLQVLACMVLLATQVKKDVTTVVVNPRYWFEMRITDYHIRHEKINISVNKMVKELELDKDFMIE